MTIIHRHCPALRLFAGAEGQAEGISGEKAASAAGKQSTGEIPAPAAGERSEKFQALIKGEYKDLYDAQVQSILKQRLKGSEETVKKFRVLSPALRLLEKKYGVAEGDTEGLSRALQNSESDAEAAREAVRQQRLEQGARRQHDSWLDEAALLQEQYSSFDLQQELADPRFCALLRGGAGIRDAYELIHRRDIMARTARDMEEMIARRVLSGSQRPREGGLSGQSAAVMKSDVAHMSRKARQDIIRRVQQGEKISF